MTCKYEIERDEIEINDKVEKECDRLKKEWDKSNNKKL